MPAGLQEGEERRAGAHVGMSGEKCPSLRTPSHLCVLQKVRGKKLLRVFLNYNCAQESGGQEDKKACEGEAQAPLMPVPLCSAQ